MKNRKAPIPRDWPLPGQTGPDRYRLTGNAWDPYNRYRTAGDRPQQAQGPVPGAYPTKPLYSPANPNPLPPAGGGGMASRVAEAMMRGGHAPGMPMTGSQRMPYPVGPIGMTPGGAGGGSGWLPGQGPMDAGQYSGQGPGYRAPPVPAGGYQSKSNPGGAPIYNPRRY